MRGKSLSIVCSLLFISTMPCAAQAPFVGDFLPPTSGVGKWGVAVGDFNDDTKLDIATTNPGASEVNIFTGNGDGTFTAGASYQLTLGRNNTLWVTASDVNGDGKLDLIVTSFNFVDQNGGKISVLLGNGDGTFQPEVDYAAGSHPITVVAADFNGDSKPDLAVTDNGSAVVLVFLNNGDGTFQAAQSYAAGAGPYSLATGDFNGDGKTDLVVGDYCNVANASGLQPSAFGCTDGPLITTLSILLGNGDGTFQSQTTVSLDTSPYQVGVADLNQDGKADVLLTNGWSLYSGNTGNTDNTLSVLLGNGDGTFKSSETYLAGTFSSAANGNTSFVVSDFNGDGIPDVMNGATEFLGNGDGTLQAGIFYEYGPPGEIVPVAGPLVAADFNQDGHIDVASSAVIIMNAGGTSRFPTTTTLSLPNVYSCSAEVTVTVQNALGPFPKGGITLQTDGQFASYLGPPNPSMATGQTNILARGTHILRAVYVGDLNTQGSTALNMVTFAGDNSSTSLGSDYNPSIFGGAGYIFADIDPPGCQAGPTYGTVTFYDGGTPLQTVPVGEDPRFFAFSASIPLSTLSVGSHSITANYSGTAYVNPSVSSVFVEQVNAPPLALGVAPGGSNTVTVQAGSTATYNLTIGVYGGDTGNGTLSCSGAPTGANCSVPSTIVLGNSSTPFNVTVTTTAASSELQPGAVHSSHTWMWALGMVGILFLPVSSRRRTRKGLREFRAVPWLLLLVLLGGCGSSSGGGSSGVAAVGDRGPRLREYTP